MINSQENSIAVIFAGGKSSRMGEDKSLMPFGEYNSIAEYQYNKLSKIFDKVYISTKEDKFNFQANLIYDKYSESSPLVGLVSIFETIKEDKCFVLSVDAPFIDEVIINILMKESKNITTIAESPNGIEPLCGVYYRSILPLAKILLKDNNHRLTYILREANARKIYFNNKNAFKNLNFIEDYKEALSKSLLK